MTMGMRYVVGTGGVVIGIGTGGEEVDCFGDGVGIVVVVEIVRISRGSALCAWIGFRRAVVGLIVIGYIGGLNFRIRFTSVGWK